MFKSKYSSVLTIVLIIIIIGIIGIATILSVGAYKNYKEEKNRKRQIAEFKEEVTNYQNENTEENEIEENENIQIEQIVIPENNQTGNSGTNSNRKKTKLYNNKYPMIGYIEIEKTNIELPILLDISPAALEDGVGISYPSNPKLNEPGNTVIIGHNYRNGKLFSNNKNLVIGDKIKITDINGRTLTYTIYEILQDVPETETEYISRDRGNNIEISLSTCTDDGKARLVILAKVE